MVPCTHADAQHILAASAVLECRARAQSHFGARCIAVARKSAPSHTSIDTLMLHMCTGVARA
eukprot:5619159-Alexandrium_andersonii.AAC.1